MYQRILILLSILVFTRNVRALNINCDGKGFFCQDSTHFYVCVDMGGGFTMTMDEVEQQCPANTICDNRNPFECMEITTTTTPKSTEASVLTLQWPPSYLSNLGIATGTVQPNPVAPIIQVPPVYSTDAPVAPPPFESFALPTVPSAAPTGTTIVKGEYADNYFKFLPIVKRDTIETLPGTVPPYVEGDTILNDAMTILPLKSTTSNPIPTLVESSPLDIVSSNENSIFFATPTNKSNTPIFTTPKSFSTFDSSTPYIIPTDEYTYTRDSTKPNSISQTQSTTLISPTQYSMTSTTESKSPTSTLLSTTESDSTTLDSISSNELSNLNSTTPKSEFTTENLINSTTEYPISSTPLDSLSTAQNLFNSTNDYPLSSTPLDSPSTVQNLFNSTTDYPLSTVKNAFNSTTEYPFRSTSLDSLSTVQNLFNSTTDYPFSSTPLDSLSTVQNLLNSTTDYSFSSTPLDSLSTVQNLLNSTTDYSFSSTPLDSLSTAQNVLNSTTDYSLSSSPLNSLPTVQNAFNSTTEYPFRSTPLDSLSTVQNLFNSTTDYPLSSTPLDSLYTVQDLFNSTTENAFDLSTFNSILTTENPFHSTLLDPTVITENLFNSTAKNPPNSTIDSILFNSTSENPIKPTTWISVSTTENLFNSTDKNLINSTKLNSTAFISTTENPLVLTKSESTAFISTTEKPLISTKLESTAFISTTENPLISTKLESTAFISTTENPLFSTKSELTSFISTTENPLVSTKLESTTFISTTENPLVSTKLEPTAVISTTENPLVSTKLDSITTTLSPLNSTDSTLNPLTPDLVLTTESSILNSVQSPDLTKPSPPPTTKINLIRENTLESFNLTETNHSLAVTSTTPVTGSETTTVKSYIIDSAPQEKDSGNSTDNVSSHFVNFSSNNLPDVPSTAEHAIFTRMIQTTEVLPFNNIASGFVPGNIANTGAYPSSALPSIPLPISNDPNAFNGCQRPGQYPDENSCHSYYLCNNNVRYKLVCPYNMVYSPSLQKCTTAKDHCSNYNDFTCNQVGRFPDSRSYYSYYDCQPNGAGFTVSRAHCPWYSSFQANNGQCVTNNNACGCQQAPQTCRCSQQAPVDYQGGQTTSFTFYPDNPITYSREYGYPAVSSTNGPVNVPIAAGTPYFGDRVLPADRVAIYNRENAFPVDPSNTNTDRDYIREKLPVGVNYPYFGDNVVPSVDRTPMYVRDSAPGAITNGYIKDYTPIVGNTPYVPENIPPISGTSTYYQNSLPADQSNTYYQNNNPGENTYTYNANVNVAPVESSDNKYVPADVGSVDRPNPYYFRDNIAPSNFDSGFNYYPPGEAANRLAGTNSINDDSTRWSQPVPNNEASQWTPNYYGSWFN